MGINLPNSTNYLHPHESNLQDLHHAMEYNPLGEPTIRSSLNRTMFDAFGRMRMSQPFTLFDSFHRFVDNGKISQKLTGTATSVHEPYSSSILLTIGTANGDSVIRETSRVFPYQPGKGLQMLITFCMAAPKANLRQRAGLFDINNGIFLEQDGTQISLVIRSTSVNGSVQENRVVQQNWNLDKLDGTGNSLIELDLTKTQIFFTDIEWLGVGSVRCGFVIDGAFIPVHTFHHANHNQTTTYMGTACLPGRVEIVNTGNTASTSSYRQICFSVISEGGYELRGRARSVGHSLAVPYRLSTPNTVYPLLSIRLKSDRLGAVVIPKNFSINVTAAAKFKYEIIAGAVTSGGTWSTTSADSSVEYNTSATSITNGTVMETGYIISSNQASISPSLAEVPFKFQLERNSFVPTCYEFTLAMSTNGNNQDVYASINWEEVT